MLIGFSAIVYLFLISNSAMAMNSYLYFAILLIPLGIGLVMLLIEKESIVDIKIALLLTIWFVGMIFASIKGVRFIILMTPTLGIAVGVAIGFIYQYLCRLFSEDLNVNEKVSKLIVFILLCLILIVPIQAGIASGKSYVPSMTKGWWDSLTKIREESQPNAIINSWWDFGHWFKYVADRPVTLDGSIQNSPNAHWLGLLLQTNDENKTIAVLRMLDCGSNNAFEEINKKYNDTEISENIVSELIMLNKADARTYLEKFGYTSSEIDTILSYSHCDPPEDYLITSEDMVGKSGVWAHFGLWNFDKAFIINNVRGKSSAVGIQLMKDRWNYSDENASQIYYEVQALQTDKEMNDWISPWPGYATGNSVLPCVAVPQTKDLVQCTLNMGIGSNAQQNIILERTIVNLSNPNNSEILVGVYDKTTNARVGQNIATWSDLIIADKDLKAYPSDNATIDLAILLNINRDNNSTTYSAVVANPSLIDSTFTKLFYLDGKGMTHFEKFSDVTDITGSRIIVWKVKW
jgi:asparagine N-glycosylation enzyme membrane subunit Stt3